MQTALRVRRGSLASLDFQASLDSLALVDSAELLEPAALPASLDLAESADSAELLGSLEFLAQLERAGLPAHLARVASVAFLVLHRPLLNLAGSAFGPTSSNRRTLPCLLLDI